MTSDYRFESDGTVIRIDTPDGVISETNPVSLTQTQPGDPNYAAERAAALKAGAVIPASNSSTSPAP